MPLRFLTAGDSHGDSLVGIIEGLPAGIPISTRGIKRDLKRRRDCYGRSSRQLLEKDAERRLPSESRTLGGG
jgi:chorismate synthase